MDETNVDWVPTLHLGHEKRQQSSQSFENRVQRSDRARERAERQRQAEEELVMLLEAVSTSSKIADETVSGLLREIGSDIVELLDIEDAAIELVM